MPYRNSYRKPYRASFTSQTNSDPDRISGCASIFQYNYVRRVIDKISDMEDSIPSDMYETIQTTIDGLMYEDADGQPVLGRMLSDNPDVWRRTRVDDASKVVGALKNIEAMLGSIIKKVAAKAAASKYLGLPSGYIELKEPSLFDSKCRKCGGKTTAGVDIAAKYSTGWQAWCLSCATADPAVANAAASAAMEARKVLHGLHLWSREVYRIEPNGDVFIRRGRRFIPAKNVDKIPFSESTRVTAEVASAYAIENKHCVNCGVSIGHGIDKRSYAVGYGPVCASTWGWYFPTHDEADTIIERRRLAQLSHIV